MTTAYVDRLLSSDGYTRELVDHPTLRALYVRPDGERTACVVVRQCKPLKSGPWKAATIEIKRRAALTPERARAIQCAIAQAVNAAELWTIERCTPQPETPVLSAYGRRMVEEAKK